MDRVDLYDHAGLMTAQTGRMFSTHVGDDLQWAGFQEGSNPPSGPARIAAHPALTPSVQLVGLAALVVAILYMDHRIKVPMP